MPDLDLTEADLDLGDFKSFTDGDSIVSTALDSSSVLPLSPPVIDSKSIFLIGLLGVVPKLYSLLVQPQDP